jgi:exodeoxyribonuclease VII large subunit
MKNSDAQLNFDDIFGSSDLIEEDPITVRKTVDSPDKPANDKLLSNPREIHPEFTVSGALDLFNQMFATATPTIRIVGEVANFKINQGKWVFFDLKDADASLGCFMSAWQLRVPVENGMQVKITATPKLTKWGKFSLTVTHIQPVGEGAILRAFELLRAKLDREGLFEPARKRALPEIPQHIAVISSTDAAGYHDFIKIINARFSGLQIDVAHVQVQGDAAADQIRGALQYFNLRANLPEVIVILRGGGSRDDLIAFDDEPLVREIAASRVPVLTGIGHEIDTTLADLAADQRASTPSNAAEILVPDRREIIDKIRYEQRHLLDHITFQLEQNLQTVQDQRAKMADQLDQIFQRDVTRFQNLRSVLNQLNPAKILARGYAIVRDERGLVVRDQVKIGDQLIIENAYNLIETEVTNVREKN